MRDIFYGKDVRKIFPKEEYKRIEPLDLKPTQLYCIEKYEYHTNTVVLDEVRLLEVENE